LRKLTVWIIVAHRLYLILDIYGNDDGQDAKLFKSFTRLRQDAPRESAGSSTIILKRFIGG
jgi:hypothetical protein